MCIYCIGVIKIIISDAFSFRLALQNTQLLKFFCDADPRVRPLVFTLRYWGKLKEVSTNPISGPRLTNYALSFLVVFFLQNTQPPILPSVAELAVLPGNFAFINHTR